MKKMKILLAAMMMFCFLAGFALASEAANMVNLPITVQEDYTKAQELFALVNAQRKSEGVEEYVLDPGMTDYAMMRAAECAVQFHHARPNGKGSNSDGLDESIAAGSGTARQVFHQWMSDSDHKRPLTDADYTHCGIGCVYYDNTIYWVINADDKPFSSGASTVPSGVVSKTRNIEWNVSTALAHEFYYSGTIVYYRDQSGIFSGTIRIRDPYQAATHNPGLGYSIPANLVNVTVTDPSAVSFDTSTGLLKPIGMKRGSTAVKITLNADPSVSTTLDITVDPQYAGTVTKGSTQYSFKYALEKNTYTYTGSPITPKFSTITDWFGNKLKEGADYELTYENNIEPGTGTVKIWLIGNYYDPSWPFFSAKKDFQIIGAPTETATPAPDVKPNPDTTPGTMSTPETTPETTPTPGTTPETTPTPGTTPETTPAPETTPETTPAPETTPETTPAPETTPETTPAPGTTPETTPAPETTPETTPAPGTTPETTPAPETTPETTPAPGTTPETTPSPETTPETTPTPGITPQVTPAPGTTDQPNKQPQTKLMTVELSKIEYTYTRKSLKPKVTVYYNGKKLAKKYYTVTYKNNKKPGSATVTVKGKAKYDGCSAKAAFTIKPKAVSLTSVKPSAKKKITVKWKKVSAVTGYQVQYSKNSRFTGGNKVKIISGESSTSVTLTGLKSKKTYYVRTRAYKSSGGKKYYGPWSEKKKVTVK